MGWVSGTAVYFMVWWTVLFAVLPWGVKTPEEPEPGMASSAPEQPKMWLRAAVTTVISALIWVAIYFLVDSGWISFREMARGM
ncbi:MAG: DUF1467 family protein [Azospirillum sp.]|nr:DUF1467 family protein [Azospirillum sp.]